MAVTEARQDDFCLGEWDGNWRGRETESVTNPALVIRDALSVLESDPVLPEQALEQTVWTRLDEDAIVFEFQKRRSGDDWRTTGSFRFRKTP